MIDVCRFLPSIIGLEDELTYNLHVVALRMRMSFRIHLAEVIVKADELTTRSHLKVTTQGQAVRFLFHGQA